MQLKTLEMLGFKSFSDKTTVVFQPGVTAVVGPNGCGKSNISDSIRWVLGEQSAKHLRGDKMEDVIFNGSESRKPLGMAQVSLTLTNVAGQLPSEFGEYSEIEITRRLYRSGESEYFINKIPCRLKDIRDLMMDAGVGAKIHAIIEQDRVDQILSSKPEDRRFLFEEVAGVMKYKARRQESLSKLESTRQNQMRVNDILTEVKRQVNSLDRQAKKAERYQKLRAELKDLDFRLASVEYSNLGLEWSSATEEFKKTENELAELHASLGRIDASIEETRAEALSAERELSEAQHRIHELETELSHAEHRVEISKGQIAALTERRGRDISDIEYLRKEMASAAERKARYEAEEREIAAAFQEKNAILKDQSDAYDRLAQGLSEKEQELEQARHGVYSAITESAAEKTKISNLQAKLSQLTEEEDRAGKELEELATRLDQLKAQRAEKERERTETIARRDAAQQKRAEILQKIERSLETKKQRELELESAKEQLSTHSSRLRSLLELEQNLEGYHKGVQAVMSARKENGTEERLGKILGLVADIIETEPQYELAIEAVLGDRLQYVVVDKHADSLKAIEFLKSESRGRSTFVPSRLREIKSEPFIKNGDHGVVGPALQVVRFNQEYTNVAQYLLGDVVIVDTIQTALHVWERNGFHKTLVTLAGEIVDPWGAVTGGAIESNGTGMLTKRREIKDLERLVAEMTGQVSRLDTTVRGIEAEIESDKKAEAELSEDIHRAEIEMVNTEKDADAVSDEIRRVEQRQTVLNTETVERSVRTTALAGEMESSLVLLQELESGHSTARAAIESLQKDLIAQKEGLEAARAGITELRLEITSLQEKQDAAARNAAALSGSETEIAERLARREADISEIESKLTEFEEIIRQSEGEIKELITTLESARSVLVSRQEAHDQKTAVLRAAEEQAKHIRHAIETVQKTLSANEVRRTELRMKIEHLKENIWASYHTELDAIVRDLGQFEINLDESRLRRDELREKIDQMGPINVDALQEYNELKERYDLLSAQQQDINESMENLKKTIAKLDSETKDLFLEAFNAIQVKFKEVFSILFEGGKAELMLLDPENILESGIEIAAQPRGKKFQSISLLSGGERALTAIALLFAAFLVKPSPFCMLDEVDAPLDEANVTRFTRLLREMSKHSQFIIITHNKRTMEIADALYGITMEEPGSSKVVSVTLREAAMA